MFGFHGKNAGPSNSKSVRGSPKSQLGTSIPQESEGDNLFLPNLLEAAGVGKLRIFGSGTSRVGRHGSSEAWRAGHSEPCSLPQNQGPRPKGDSSRGRLGYVVERTVRNGEGRTLPTKTTFQPKHFPRTYIYIYIYMRGIFKVFLGGWGWRWQRTPDGIYIEQ